MVLSGELASSSFLADEVRLAKILLKFRDKPLKFYTPLLCDNYLDSLILDGKSPATRNRYRALLHSLFKYAVHHGYLLVNPITSIRILSEKRKTRETGYLRSWDEVNRYIRSAFNLAHVFGVGASILCLGGIRIGEALALQWEDIEWKENYIRIRRTVERHSNLVCQRTKGQRAGGEYQMLLLPQLRKTLLKWKSTNAAHGSSKFILHRDKVRITYDSFATIHFRVLQSAGLERITLHDLRRTFATLAEKAGFHKAEIGELLGHETLSATEVYTKMDMSHLVSKARRVRFGG